jgi:hypothetical protein
VSNFLKILLIILAGAGTGLAGAAALVMVNVPTGYIMIAGVAITIVSVIGFYATPSE